MSQRNHDVYSDLTTYTDILIVHIRALCIENERYVDNYTAQNFFESMDRIDLKDSITDLFNKDFGTEFNDEKGSIRDFIKICSDKYVCHHDDINPYDNVKIEIAFAKLNNPMFEHNMKYIYTQIIEHIHAGFAYLYELNHKKS